MTRSEDTGRQIWAWIVLAVLAVSFLVVAQRFFADRYARGDVYPAYSSWGSDADGTRALYRALQALDTLQVVRSVQPLSRAADDLEVDARSTALLLAGWAGRGGRRMAPLLDSVARSGVRVVVAAAPVVRDGAADETGDEESAGEAADDDSLAERQGDGDDRELPAEGESEAEADDTTDSASAARATPLNVLGRWGAKTVVSGSEEPWSAARSARAPADLPAELEWPSRLYFELSSDAWTVLYATADGPVLIERSLGAGSLVLATSNHFLTNRTQAEARQTALVSHLLAGAERLVFEESHLGIVASPGIVALARRYDLHGVGLALIAVMVLAVWRGASSLMPAMERLAPSGVEARSSREGMVSLLRRGIAERELLDVCLEQWSAGARHDVSDMETRSVARASDPVEGYRRLSRLLKPTRRSG